MNEKEHGQAVFGRYCDIIGSQVAYTAGPKELVPSVHLDDEPFQFGASARLVDDDPPLDMREPF